MNYLIDKLYASFIKNSESDCIRTSNQKYTYGEVLKISDSVRSLLKDIQPQNIGVLLTNDVHMYAAILAIWLEGKTYVPVHPDFPFNKNQNIVSLSEMGLILSSKKNLEDYGVPIIHTMNLPTSVHSKPVMCSEKNNAYILFTSGSTGDPKGVPVSFENLSSFSVAFERTFGELSPKDSVLQMFELTFDLSLMSYLIPWLYGAAVVVLDDSDAKYLQILDLLEANKITVALMVPSILNLLIPYLDPEITNSSLRLNLFCGEALLIKQINGWKGFVPNANLYNVYGPTENTIFCSYYPISNPVKEKNGIISIGRALPFNNLTFENNEAQEGELLLSGKMTTKGYWKNESKTTESYFEKDGILHYRSGDWCVRDTDGDFFYINRIDLQTKINGHRIELSEIEYFANEILNNAISIALVVDDKNGNNNLILFVNDNECETEDILQHLKHNLPEYAVPNKIIKIQKYPENTSGKIDRKELKKLYYENS